MTRLKGNIKTSYRGIVFTFGIVTIFLIGLIVYFSFSKTVIRVYPSVRNVEGVFTWQIGDLGNEVSGSESFLSGKIFSREVEGEQTFSDLGETQSVPAKASGKVIIHNDYSKVQPLVATTRLLSQDGVLFRTRETVRVFPGKTVTVDVIADKEGPSGNIDPSRFTIVALWPGLQDTIYGVSSEPMTGGMKNVQLITSTSLTQAEASLVDSLYQKGIKELSYESNLQNSSWTLVTDVATKEVLDLTSDAHIGDEVESFTTRGKLRVTALSFDREKLFDLATERLKEQLPPADELLRVDPSQTKIEIVDINGTTGIATVSMHAVGDVILRLSNPILDRSNFSNKDRQDIATYLLDFDEIQRVEVRFSPFWSFRAPALEDHIEIQIVKPEF